MSYADDHYAAHTAKQASITRTSTAAQIRTAETAFYQRLHVAALKWGVSNGAAQALISRGDRLPSATEVI